MSVPRCIGDVNRNRRGRPRVRLSDGRARRGWLHEVYYTFVSMCRLNKQKLVPWVIATPFHSNRLRQKGCQSWKFREDRSRTFWNNWRQTNSKSRKQFQKLGSSNIVKNGAIRQNTHSVRLPKQIYAYLMPFRRYRPNATKKGWIQSTKKLVAMATSLKGSKK